MSDAYSKLEPHRAEIEEARRGGMSWEGIGQRYQTRKEIIRDWCETWMDGDLLKNPPRGAGSPKAQKNKAEKACLATANQRFAEAMAGAVFSDALAKDGGVFRIDRPATHVNTAANS